MTHLLLPPNRRPGTSSVTAPAGSRGSPGLVAALAGAGAAGISLLGCAVAALVGWFGADAGAHGTTRDALRVGADAWMLSLGAHLEVAGVTITAVPLGLTLLVGLVCYRCGRWAGARGGAPDVHTWGRGVLVLSVTHAALAVLVAVLASLGSARPAVGGALAGGLVLPAVFGGLGLATSGGRLQAWRARCSESVRTVVLAGLCAVFLVCGAAALLVAGSLVLDFGAAANVLARMHADASDSFVYTLVAAGVVPNAVLLGVAYLVGPGFLVGTGTTVSTGVVSLGPVPAFPMLAALPDDGPTPGWVVALAAVPPLAAAVAVWLAQRRSPGGAPVTAYDLAALRGLGAGVLAGVVLGVLVSLAGGAVGPGRMHDVGAFTVQTLGVAVVGMGLGGALGGVATVWWQRRSRRSAPPGRAAAR